MTKLYQITEPTVIESRGISVGIDLGTTNSLVAYHDNNGVKICDMTPSIIEYEGIEVTSIKRYMGLDKVIYGNNIEVSPVYISSKILEKIKAAAEIKLGGEIKDAVITVPAHFNEKARRATREAAKLAGIEMLRIINEPTAAALAYGLDKGFSGRYLVFDLGGGTFDVSIIKQVEGIFQVLATDGDLRLGGDNIDILISEYLQRKYNISSISKAQACIIKEHLADHDIYIGKIEGIEFKLSSIELMNICEPIFIRIFKIINNVLLDSQLEIIDIDEIVMVGGSTRLRGLKDRVQSFFSKDVIDNIDPDTVVAVGAAIQASILSGNVKASLLDVNPISLGIEVFGGEFEILIPKNLPLPAEVNKTFTTAAENQAGFIIHIMQGDGPLIDSCVTLKKFELSNFNVQNNFQKKINICFRLDIDGILTVDIADLHSEQLYSTQMRCS